MIYKAPLLPNTTITIRVIEPDLRLDHLLVKNFEGYSRSFFQGLIEKGHVRVNEVVVAKNSMVLKENDVVAVYFPLPPVLVGMPFPEGQYDIKIVYEHEHFLIISKPAHLMVHSPAHEHTEPTLVDWLVNAFADLREVGDNDRPGIVHRLDKDTSGLMIIPRNNYAHAIFGEMFRTRAITKQYLAVVQGHPEKTGTISYPITRDPVAKHKMTHTQLEGRDAVTNYEVLEYLTDASLVLAHPLTGRTHQIRVHMAGIGHPLIGDARYGSSSKLIDRHALHACSLSFDFLGHYFSFIDDIPDDMQRLVEVLRQGKKTG